MIERDIAIVFDCGATNVRVIAMDTSGQIVASESMPNETDEDPYYPGGRIWDMEKMWSKLTGLAKAVSQKIDLHRIAGITVTTFGVDGSFTDLEGNLLYPVISWQCPRTNPIMENINRYIPLEELYRISGVYPYAFNTINKLIWFREDHPDIPDKAYRFLFIPSILIEKLTGTQQNDTTMAGTSMLTSLQERNFSNEILSQLGFDSSLFGELAEPGQKAGELHRKAAEATGFPEGTPVFFAGHDSQFAIFGSGANLHQPVLSSGTWEVLMARSRMFNATTEVLKMGITAETDALPGVFNIGQNWLGSGVLEWFSRHFYPGMEGDDLYRTMIQEAEVVPPGSNGLHINPAFYAENGSGGQIKGLTLRTSRAEIYRALLESLAFRLKEGLEALQTAGGFTSEQIICVGGGSKNHLWNQLRADVCGIPIQLIEQKETTVLGAALFVFQGAGLFASVEEARAQINYDPVVITPSQNSEFYQRAYEQYLAFLKQDC